MEVRAKLKVCPMESEETNRERVSNRTGRQDGDSQAPDSTALPLGRSLYGSQEWYHESQERFRSLLENSYNAIALVSEYSDFVYASPSTHRVLGYATEELLGRSELELVHPDDRELAQGVFAELLQKPSAPVSVQLRVRHRDGFWRRVEIVGTNLLAEPSVQAIVVYFCDITERKQTEERLRGRARQQAVVAELGQIALGRMKLSDLMNAVVARVAQTLDVAYSNILELLPDGKELLLRAGVGWKAGYVGHAMVSADRGSQAGYILPSSDPVFVEDLGKETRFSAPPLLVEHGVVSNISVSIHGPDRPFGVLGAYTSGRREFTPDDINFLQSIANLLATAIERARAEETIRKLSTPVLPVRPRLLILPVIGEIDKQRVDQLGEQLLNGIRAYRAKAVVIDVTGVPFLEIDIVRRLVQQSEAARLLGADVIFTGVSSDFSQALVASGLDLRRLISLGDLQSGLEEAERMLGYTSPTPSLSKAWSGR